MLAVCEICVEPIESEESGFRCSFKKYSPEELALMGLDPELSSLMCCDARAHLACYYQLIAPRDCCAPPAIVDGRCFRHATWPPGFVCLDCNRWHSSRCAAT